MSKFVKTVTNKEVKTVYDGDGPDLSYISVVPKREGRAIDLVIGAMWEDRCASSFNKESLSRLIDILAEIRDAMK